MKVVYNACFGYYDLSNIGISTLAELKGIKIYWYTKRNNSLVRYKGVPNQKAHTYIPSTKDLGLTLQEDIDPKYIFELDDVPRSDVDLVKVVEVLGELASTNMSNLQIKEIPDGVEYEITEYDGCESVVPPRQVW